MDNQKTLIFDFDGTLADTFTMSVEILQKVLPRKYIDRLDFTKIDAYKNSSTKDLANMIQLKAWRIPFLVWKARIEMNKRVNEIKPIAGIPAVLESLHEKNIRMFVLSTNSSRIIKEFLRINGLDCYFENVLSTRLLFDKHRLLMKLVSSAKLDLNHTYYVGDEIRDIDACNISGVKCISVTWGFNSKDILLKRNSFKVINSPMELIDFVR